MTAVSKMHENKKYFQMAAAVESMLTCQSTSRYDIILRNVLFFSSLFFCSKSDKESPT